MMVGSLCIFARVLFFPSLIQNGPWPHPIGSLNVEATKTPTNTNKIRNRLLLHPLCEHFPPTLLEFSTRSRKNFGTACWVKGPEMGSWHSALARISCFPQYKRDDFQAMGLAQKYTTREPQVLVNLSLSLYRQGLLGTPCWARAK